MQIRIPCRHTAEIANLFTAIGEPVRFVGGCVRDTIAKQQVKDIDLATPALPATVLETAENSGYRVIPTGLQHGTVTVVIEGEGYEITTLRADVETDGRHATVAFVNDFETDAARRDFTFNAMSADLDGTVHDYFGGVDDLKAARVRFVGDLDDRLTEDYLRILRFYRFRARYGGTEPEGYVEAVGRHADGLRRISGERIWSELSRIIVMRGADRNLLDMERTGVLEAAGLRLSPADRTAEILGRSELSGGNAGAMLGLVAADEAALKLAAGRWKISTLDRTRADLALRVRRSVESFEAGEGTDIHDWHYWMDGVIDGNGFEDTRACLDIIGLRHVAAELPLQVPVFPVAGQDLIDRGMKPSREMGTALRALKDTWKASGYTLTRDELIEGPSPSIATGGGPRL
jgi:tRNA nucleotidyltransferase/poly(A) polymerase